MRLHPVHPISVHAPIACIALAPLADLGAVAGARAELWAVSAWLSAAALVLGLVAASFGAMDFERAYAKARGAVSAHAALMAVAVTLAGASAFGRFDAAFAVRAAPEPWSIAASLAALVAAGAGGFFGGELVYRHGVNVDGRG